MNERIKELVEQCETKEIGYYFFDREKFAKLIVRECANVADNESGLKPSYRMKKHFGVEE